ncbi:MAG: DUF6273 domain-containing protein [Bacillota bacterium]|nr:DUF6273 domain-containing protein [Bacillota bacterium]
MREKRRKATAFAIVFMALCLIMGTLPGVAVQAYSLGEDSSGIEKTIQLVGTDTSSEGIRNQDHIWFGTKDEENYLWTDEAPYWRVLDADHMNNGEAGMLLLSEGLIANNADNKLSYVVFNPTSQPSHIWPGSRAQDWCGAFLTNVFSRMEQEAIAATHKSDKPYSHFNEGVEWPWRFDVCPDAEWNYLENILNGDKVFFLSAQEAASSNYGLGTQAERSAYFMDGLNHWWLRSPSRLSSDMAGEVTTFGVINDDLVYTYMYARPAFNLDLSNVLFSTKVYADPDTGSGTYKLTVKDDGLRIAIPEGEDISKDGGLIRVPHVISGENADEDTKAVVLITDREYTDSEAELKYYGELGDDGIVSLEDDSWYVYLLAENRNGEKETDYASEPLQIYPHAHIFSYSAEGSVVTAKCKGIGTCDITDESELTVNLEAPEAADLVYDGSAKAAMLSADYNDAVFSGPIEIRYFDENDNELAAADVKNAGKYVARVSFGKGASAATAQVEFEIRKADREKPEPPAARKVTYTGITLKKTGGCEYSMNGRTWQDSAAFTGLKENRKYTFYQRIKEDKNHNASPESSAVIRTARVKAGDIIRNAGGRKGQEVRVDVRATDKKNGRVTYTKAPNRKYVTIPKFIKMCGKRYAVAAIGQKAFTGKRIRTITAGANVKKIAKYAFKKSKAKKLIVKTKKLTKRNVKGCLKGSAIRTIKVKVGTKTLNKKYIKKYKKIFTKRNTGKKATVK